MAIESWRFGNPLSVLLRIENRTCKGCKNLQEERVFERILSTCTKGKKKLKRCRFYKDED